MALIEYRGDFAPTASIGAVLIALPEIKRILERSSNHAASRLHVIDAIGRPLAGAAASGLIDRFRVRADEGNNPPSLIAMRAVLADVAVWTATTGEPLRARFVFRPLVDGIMAQCLQADSGGPLDGCVRAKW